MAEEQQKKGFKANVSNLMNRMMLAMRAGLAFRGKRDYYEVFGYPKQLTSELLFTKYIRQGIAARAVDSAPEEMWSYPPILKEPSGEQSKWDKFTARHDFWQKVIQADKLCAFGEFSLIWLGLPGAPEKPAPQVSSLDDILFVQSYGGTGLAQGDSTVTVKSYEDSTSNPRYGQPVMYEVRVGPENQRKLQQVHYSRVVHVVDRPIQGVMFAQPRMAQLYNTLDDLLKVGGGSAELYWLTANRGLHIDVDKEMELDTDDAAALSAEVDEYQHQLRRVLRTRGVKVETLGSEVADPRGVFQTLLSDLAASTNIPQRILIGSEAGQLASEQDRANWADYIERRRAVFGVPFILKPALRVLERLGYLAPETADSAVWEWPEAFHTSPLEESNIYAAKARAVVNLTRRNQYGNPLVSDEEARRMINLPDKVPTGETLPKAPVAKGAFGNPVGAGGNGKTPSGAGTSADNPASTNPPAHTQSHTQ